MNNLGIIMLAIADGLKLGDAKNRTSVFKHSTLCIDTSYE